jgi:hypothetical protein
MKITMRILKPFVLALLFVGTAAAAMLVQPASLGASDCGNGTRWCGSTKVCTDYSVSIFGLDVGVEVCSERRVYHPPDDDDDDDGS